MTGSAPSRAKPSEMDSDRSPRRTASAPTWHLIDQASPQSDPVTLAYLAQRGERVLLLGGTPLRRRAQAAGLTIGQAQELPVPAGHAGWGVNALRKWLRQHRGHGHLHVWSLSVLTALRWLGHRDHTLHLTVLPRATELDALRKRAARTLKIQTFGQVLRQQLTDAGIHTDRTTAISPWPIDAVSSWLSGQRDALRAAWEIEADAPVVALLGDPSAAADTGPATSVIDLVGHATRRKLYLLVHPLQAGRSRIQAVLDNYRQADRLIQDARLATPWRVLAGCDAALLGTAPATASARFAVAAGLPIVAPDMPTHRETLADADHAHFARTAEPKRLAHQMQHHALRLPGMAQLASV